MARYKRYLETDVVTEAAKRIHHIYDLFDSVAVCFSGGKDSLVCLNLVWQVAQERGLDHVDVVFRDEELIPSSVLDFVNEYRQKPWVRLKWFCYPLKSEKFILGKRWTYVQWDRDRPWIRPKPEWAIVQPADQYRVLDQYTADEACAEGMKGNVAFITGIRASESLVRYRSVVNKLNDNYICTPAGADPRCRVKVAKPIYDWEENDIFKWMHENGIRWCPLYNAQHVAGQNLRVSTPLHAESSKRIGKWREIDPVFYEQVLSVFPEMKLQDRYWNEYDAAAVRDRYSDGFAGCLRYIEREIADPVQKKTAMQRYREFTALNKKDPVAYPASSLLGALVSGSIKRVIMPVVKDKGRTARATH